MIALFAALWVAQAEDPGPVRVELGGSQVLTLPFAVDRVVVGNPAVADVTTLGANQLAVIGKAIGETQLAVTSRNGRSRTYLVLTSHPTAGLAHALEAAFPEGDFEVQGAGDSIVLKGRVPDAAAAEAAGRIAESLYGGSVRAPKVINLLEVAGRQQVQVQLKFVEVSRTALRAIGLNVWQQSAGRMGALLGPGGAAPLSGPQSGISSVAPELPILGSPIAGTFGVLFAQAGALPISATLSVLQSHGLAKTLSEPTLVALSGEQANLLVGGEFPVPMPDALGRMSVDFKSFGVQLDFVPTVLADDTVQLALKTVVSDLDASAGVMVSNITVPGLTSRESRTTIRLRDGQSFAIAGLLSDTLRNNVQKVPVLGDIPVLGMLFRSVQYRREETELVVLVSVRLVQPLAPGTVPPLPGEDEISDPGDLRLFLLGTIDAGAPAGAVGFER